MLSKRFAIMVFAYCLAALLGLPMIALALDYPMWVNVMDCNETDLSDIDVTVHVEGVSGGFSGETDSNGRVYFPDVVVPDPASDRIFVFLEAKSGDECKTYRFVFTLIEQTNDFWLTTNAGKSLGPGSQSYCNGDQMTDHCDSYGDGHYARLETYYYE